MMPKLRAFIDHVKKRCRGGREVMISTCPGKLALRSHCLASAYAVWLTFM